MKFPICGLVGFAAAGLGSWNSAYTMHENLEVSTNNQLSTRELYFLGTYTLKKSQRNKIYPKEEHGESLGRMAFFDLEAIVS